MIYFNQAVSLALIYIYRASAGNINMIGYNQAKEYEKVVNQNLQEMNSTIGNLTPDSAVTIDDLFFFYAEDRDESSYYVLKPDERSIKQRVSYIINLPFDVVYASQMPNALDILGLDFSNGQIIEKQEKLARTRKKEDTL